MIYQKLEKLIGRKFHYMGCDWLLVDVMKDMDSIALRRLDDNHQIQTNQYGSPNRKCQEVILLPISGEDTDSWSEEITQLFEGKIDPPK